jgi:hypothetical protein
MGCLHAGVTAKKFCAFVVKLSICYGSAMRNTVNITSSVFEVLNLGIEREPDVESLTRRAIIETKNVEEYRLALPLRLLRLFHLLTLSCSYSALVRHRERVLWPEDFCCLSAR